MDQPVAEIVALGDRSATVAVRTAVCPRCASGKGCGAGLLTGSAKIRHIEVLLPRGRAFELGDTVRLSIDPSSLLHLSWLAYGLPLLALLAGSLAGLWWSDGSSDTAPVVFAMTGLIVGVIAARRLLQKKACLRQIRPTIITVGQGD